MYDHFENLSYEIGMMNHNMPITPEQLAQWKTLEEKATKGPWEDRTGIFSLPDEPPGTSLYSPDAAFIAAARTAVPLLIAEVERLQDQKSAASVSSCTK